MLKLSSAHLSIWSQWFVMQAATLCGHVIQDGRNVNKVYNKPMQNIGAEVLLWHPGNVRAQFGPGRDKGFAEICLLVAL